MEEKVIKAALEELKIHSFRFTMEDLARRLHMSKSSIYKVMASKEELVHCILDYIMEIFNRELEKAAGMSVDKRLDAFINSYTKAFQFFLHGVYNDLQMSYPQEWERWENFRQTQVENVMSLLAEGVEQGVLRPMNKAVVQRCLLVMSSSLADMNFLRENDLTYSKAIAAMRDWMFYGLLREPAGAPAK